MIFFKIFEIGSSDTHSYMILRGSVRIFNQMAGENKNDNKVHIFFQEDLGPGDVFGISNVVNLFHI